jgi:hypothetical protein
MCCFDFTKLLYTYTIHVCPSSKIFGQLPCLPVRLHARARTRGLVSAYRAPRSASKVLHGRYPYEEKQSPFLYRFLSLCLFSSLVSPAHAGPFRPSLGKVEPAKLAPSLVRISPTAFLHVLTTPLEPAKPLAHLHGRPTRRSRGSGGPRSTPPPFSIAGAPPAARNDKNRTPGEPTPLPRPFPAKFGLLLAGFRPSSSLSAVWTTLRGLRSF